MKLALYAELTQEHLVVVRSTLKLRKEDWQWVSRPELADVLICDIESQYWRKITTDKIPYQIIIGDLADENIGSRLHLPLPLRALKLIKQLDTIVQKVAQKAAQKTVNKLSKPNTIAKPAVTGVTGIAVAAPKPPPWANKNLQFKDRINFAEQQVSSELTHWLNIMTKQPVDYASLKAALPMDTDLIDTVLNTAAESGLLIDDKNQLIPPIDNRSILTKLFKK